VIAGEVSVNITLSFTLIVPAEFAEDEPPDVVTVKLNKPVTVGVPAIVKVPFVPPE